MRFSQLPSVAVLITVLAVAGPARAADHCGRDACRGYGVAVSYLGEEWWNAAGGLRTDDTWLDNLDLAVTAAPGSLGVPGLAGRLVVLRNNANELSAPIVGDLQIASNIDAPAAWRLYEAWVEWSPGTPGRFSVRAGIYAADQEFIVTPTGAIFLHSAPGTNTEYASAGLIGPPIFPLSGWAVRLAGAFGDGGYWLAAVMDGVPGNPDDISDFHYRWQGRDGALLQGEAGVTGGRWNKVAIGAWTYSTELESQAAGTDGNPLTDDWETGAYALADLEIASGRFGELSGYVQGGIHTDGFARRGRFNAFTRFLGAGVTWGGFLAARSGDQMGLMVASAWTSDALRDDRADEGLATDARETALELTYRAHITDWLAIQPDLQYIINPGVDPGLGNALVVGVRFEMTFGREW